MTSVMTPKAERRWQLAEGDEIAPGLHALDRLGGGHRYGAYLAFDDRLHSIVVAKIVRPHLVDDEHTLAGLRGEAAMLAGLAHPVIVRSFGATLDGPRPHLVLEHVEGPRLSTLVRRHGPLPPEQLIPLALQLCSALHYLAREGVVHLDVKPANVIMSGPPRLIDLSVALGVEEAAALDRPIGTDGYMAPEQCDPARLGPPGPAADLFGLGATLYRAVAGARPFETGDADSDGAARWPQLAEDPAPLPATVPREVAEAIGAALDRDPRRRPSAAALADRLEPVLAAQPKPKLGPLKPRWN